MIKNQKVYKMKILNLVRPNNSDIQFKTSAFPDGQQDITLTSWRFTPKITDIGVNDQIQIKSRLSTFKDLELIICATKALRRLKVKEIHLYIPYLLGARSDRKFVDGGTSYLVDVIAPIINAQGYESVTVIDVHSDVAGACINNLEIINNSELVKFFIDHMVRKNNGSYVTPKLISPDGGSLKKIYKLCEKIGIQSEVIVCSKYRDTDGKLSKTNVPGLNTEPGQKEFVIIDDICDGGRTFIEIAKVILQDLPKSVYKTKIHLIVTHGIFSAGFDELYKYFDTIFCTNSVNEWSTNYDVFPKHSILTQMNVF
jgi:ribose-phosphate pyrophosphokinase